MEQYEFTNENNVKYRFKANKQRGFVEIEVGVIPTGRDRHIVAMSTVEPIKDDQELAEVILHTMREWDDCEGYEILTEEDAGVSYTYWED